MLLMSMSHYGGQQEFTWYQRAPQTVALKARPLGGAALSATEIPKQSMEYLRLGVRTS